MTEETKKTIGALAIMIFGVFLVDRLILNTPRKLRYVRRRY